MFDIEDTLSTNEFNKILYLLKQNKSFKEDFKIHDNVKLEYADLTFKVTGVSTSKGILLNEDSVSNVKLSNPFFENAEYKLTLKLLKLPDYNVEENTFERETLIKEYTLTQGNTVNLNLHSLMKHGYVYYLLLDAFLTVSFKNAHELNLADSFQLTAEPNIISTDETSKITATLLNTEGKGMNNEPIKFYVNNTLIDTVNTDSEGVASVYYLGQGTGVLNIKSECNVMNQTITLKDCILFDHAISSDYNNTAWGLSGANLTRNEEGTTISESSSSALICRANTTFKKGCLFEFKQHDGVVSTHTIYLRNHVGTTASTNLVSFNINEIGGVLNDWLSLEIEVQDNQVIFTNHGTGKSVTKGITPDSEGYTLLFTSPSSNKTLSFKNVLFY